MPSQKHVRSTVVGHPRSPHSGRSAADYPRSAGDRSLDADSHHGLVASNPQLPAGLNEWAGDTTSGVNWRVIRGDCRHVLRGFRDNRFACVVTSPPYYWQRDYDVPNQIGLEPTIDGYVNAIATSMDEVRRVLHRHGLLFLNLADTYYSAKGQPKGSDKKNRARRFGLRAVDAAGLGVARKTLIGIPWRVALALIIGALKSEALLNESVGAGYIERNWPPALKESAAWPLASLRQSFLNGSLTRLVDPDTILKVKIVAFVSRGDFGLASSRNLDGSYERVWSRS